MVASTPARRAGYTLLELHVALVVLGVGLFSLPPLMAMQSRQIRRVEAWCRDEPEFHLVSPTNRWLRRLGASADVEAEAGETPWTPPVEGSQVYDLRLRWVQQDPDEKTFEADVTVRARE